MTWRRVRKSLKSKRDQSEFDAKQAQIEDLQELAETGYIDLFYYDESHFSLTPSVPYAWQEKGQTVELPSSRGKSINVAGFYSKDNRFSNYQYTTAIDAEKLIDVFNDFIGKTTKKTVIILDNAPIHKSKLFMSCLPKWEQESDTYLFFLPTYSPELNMIEILWRKIKYEWLEWSAYLSFKNLQESLNTVCKNVGKKFNIQFG